MHLCWWFNIGIWISKNHHITLIQVNIKGKYHKSINACILLFFRLKWFRKWLTEKTWNANFIHSLVLYLWLLQHQVGANHLDIADFMQQLYLITQTYTQTAAGRVSNWKEILIFAISTWTREKKFSDHFIVVDIMKNFASII